MTVFQLIRLAVAYVLLGAAGLALAIPPGYASPIFPAAGLAVAIALSYGQRAIPAIWLGSLTLNTAHAAMSGGFPTLNDVIVAALIASGSSLQAWTACWLVRRSLGDAWKRLENERDTLKFLLIGGVLTCIVAPSLNVSVLLATGAILEAQFAYTWWNWYVGDLMGVLIFAPLIWCFIHPEDDLWRERRSKMATPVLLTLALVTIAFYGVARWDSQTLRQQLIEDGEKVAKHIADRLITHREILASINHFIEARPSLSFSEFEVFTRIILSENPDIFALSVNDLVADTDRLRYEQTLSGLTPLGAFHIIDRDSQNQAIPAANRPHHVVVRYIAPLANNASVLGFDINSEPIRHDAIQRAITTRKMAVTAPIRLVQEKKSGVGVLELDPVLEQAHPDSPGNLRVLGFAVGVIKVDEMMKIATRTLLPPGLSIAVSDPQAPEGQTLLYQSDSQSPQANETPSPDDKSWSQTLFMGDRPWVFTIMASEAYLQEHRPWLAVTVGVAGLLFTSLLQTLLLGMTGRAAVIKRQNRLLVANQEQIERLAYYDTVTGLPNRVLGHDCAQQAIIHAVQQHTQMAVMLLGLNKFKLINDSYGHAMGDQLLKHVAERLKSCIRAEDTVCRLAGNDFMVVLGDIRIHASIHSIREKVLQRLADVFEINGRPLRTSCSIGIAVYPEHGVDVETLLRNADTALHEAKSGGSSTYRLFDESMSQKITHYLQTRDELKRGFDKGEFELYYQPQICLKTRKITGAEALIRWNHPERGVITPGEFIHIAEESGLMAPMGEWVLDAACQQLAQWHCNGIVLNQVAVNVSALQFRQKDFYNTVLSTLERTKLPPHHLELELTESMLAEDQTEILSAMRRLHSLGIQLSIDDFGTGYSNLSYLKRFNVHQLKVDKAFVRDILENREDQAIVQAIIQMANSLNLKTIAEGVESAGVAFLLDELGCHVGQGYLYSPALPVGAFADWYRSWESQPQNNSAFDTVRPDHEPVER